MNRKMLLLAILVIPWQSNAQYDLSFKFGGGFSIITNSATVNQNHLQEGSPIETKFGRSLEGGVNFHYYFERISLETGINYSKIGSHQNESTQADHPDTQIPTSIFVQKYRRAHYFALPLLINRDFNRFSVGGGLQPQLAFKADEVRLIQEGMSFPASIPQIQAVPSVIKQWDIGAIGQINIRATKRLSLNVKAYIGLTDINNFREKGAAFEFNGIENPVVDRRLKTRQFVITAQYNIWGKKAR